MNVLVTCAGRRHYLVQYIKDFIGAAGTVVGTDMSPYAPALAACDKTYVSLAVTHPEYIEQLIQICKAENINFIFSVNDLELAQLSKNKDRIKSESGAIAVVSDPEAIEIGGDKYLTYGFFKKLGIPSPATFIHLADAKAALRNGEISFPLMVKPRWGSASISLLKVEHLEDLDQAFHACGEAVAKSILHALGQSDAVIIQEFIDGQEYGLDILNSLDKKYIGHCVKKKLAMRSGETDKATPLHDERFSEHALKIANHLQHIGNLDCDVLEKNGQLHFLELNPRFGGGYPFTHMAGANHIALLLSGTQSNDLSSQYQYESGYTYAKCDTLVRFKNI